MRVRDKLSGKCGEIVGVIKHDAWRGTEFAIVMDGGTWASQYASNLEPLNVPDMSITVGHIIDNPTFDTEMAYKIGVWDAENGDWDALYDSRVMDDVIPVDLLIEKVTFMTIEDGQLILEVRR